MKNPMQILKDPTISKKKKGLGIAGIAFVAVFALNAVIAPLMPPAYAKEATAAAEQRIADTHVSKAALLADLEEEYSPKAAEYALKQVADTDWNQEAAEALSAYASQKDVSQKRLQRNLEQDLFENEEIQSAFDSLGKSLDYNEHALNYLTKYASAQSENFSRASGRKALSDVWFTDEEIAQAIDTVSMDWQQQATQAASSLLANCVSEAVLKESLLSEEYLENEISKAIEFLQPDYKANCLNALRQKEDFDRCSQSELKQIATQAKFSEDQISWALEQANPDWKYNAIRRAADECANAETTLSTDDLSKKILEAGFGQDEKDFVIKYYNVSSGTVDSEDTIRQKIQAEEEERKKAEEEARLKAEEEARKQAEEQARLQQEAAAAQAAASERVGTMVWIPRTGSKYHSTSTCSNMKSPSQVTLETAQQLGYGRCKKCW